MDPKLNRGNIEIYYNDNSISSFLRKNIDSLSGNVLDIGCGKMKYKNFILSGKNVNKYTGLDLEEGKFTYSVKADLYWDGNKIPLEDNSVDSAILFEVIEHCPDPKIVIKEAYRVLKPGGTILFSTPYIYPLHGMPYDYNRPSPSGLEKLFTDAGFSKTTIEAGGKWDASLAQMIAIWITKRPMPKIFRKILRLVFVLIFQFLLWIDEKQKNSPLEDGTMMPNLLGKSVK